MYDKSQKDLGTLIKMNHLMNRLEVIQYLVGDWKSSNNKYVTMTEQIHYV